MKTKTLLSVLLMFVAMGIVKAQNSFNVEIKEVKSFDMLYYDFTGPYPNAYQDFGKLMAYIGENNIKTGPYSVGLYFDDPKTVAEDKLRSQVGHMIVGKSATNEVFKTKTVRSGKAVSVTYHNMSEIMDAYEALGGYILDKGLKTEGFSIEVYKSQDPAKMETEILMLLK
ncbi:MAG: GyrI-like domain-containing protein [Bacteroidales bacterium]|nr:GyrI-like domain-containing protein [Bacteroidales bacterium]